MSLTGRPSFRPSVRAPNFEKRRRKTKIGAIIAQDWINQCVYIFSSGDQC